MSGGSTQRCVARSAVLSPGSCAVPRLHAQHSVSPHQSLKLLPMRNTHPDRQRQPLCNRSNPMLWAETEKCQFNMLGTHNQMVKGRDENTDSWGQLQGSRAKHPSCPGCCRRDRAAPRHTEPALQTEIHNRQQQGTWRKQHASKRK